MSSLPAGWYKDPADPETQRYWDGDGWLGKAIPADATPPAGPPEPEPEPLLPEDPAAPETPAEPVQQAIPGMPPPPPGWRPPPGWQPPPGWTPPPGWPPLTDKAAYLPYPVEARPHGLALAGLGARLSARLIDIAAVLVLNVVVNGWFAYQWFQVYAPGFREVFRNWDNPAAIESMPQPDGRGETLTWVMLALCTLIWLAYEAPAHAAKGQTLGKRLMRIKVVGVDSTEPIGFGRSFARWARMGLWTPAWYCCGFGLFMQLLDAASPIFDLQLRQAYHDKTARTVVVALPPGYRHPTPTAGGDKAPQDATAGRTPEGR